jgi:hypothetical protein
VKKLHICIFGKKMLEWEMYYGSSQY